MRILEYTTVKERTAIVVISYLPGFVYFEEHGALAGEEVVPHVQEGGLPADDGLSQLVVDGGIQGEPGPVGKRVRETLQPRRAL